MSFDVAADSYDAFMGRYSVLLSPQLADFAGVVPGQYVLDVGCGPGALTAELARRVGPERVTAVDPEERFVAAARSRNPGATVSRASAERLPFDARTFEASLAQLVVHFMTDPVAGLAEMARVTRRGGTVAACVWDYAGDRAPLSVFWRVAHEMDAAVTDESELPGARKGSLSKLFSAAGLRDVEERLISASVTHASFEEWWEPYTRRVGPAGVYVAGLDPERRNELRERCRRALGDAPFEVRFSAWAARGSA